ncbi:ras-GEF domain-containing family member 1B-like isoform X2 [Pollicipes pollicipes]|nr:ras-GEF domain-containing family member 1B-like isoform X2 [Pollicipes pollicipes]
MDSTDAQAAVDGIFGAGRAQVVDVQTSTVVREEEVIFINGVQVKLIGDEGAAIRHALTTGTVPNPGVLSQLLVRNGILNFRAAAFRGATVETALDVNTSVTTRDTMLVHQQGRVVDRRSQQSRAQCHHASSSVDVLRGGVSRLAVDADVDVRGGCGTCGLEGRTDARQATLYAREKGPPAANDSGYINGDSEGSSCGDGVHSGGGSFCGEGKPTIFGTVTGGGGHVTGGGSHAPGTDHDDGRHANGTVTHGHCHAPHVEAGVRRGRSAPGHINGGSPRSSSSDHSTDKVTVHSPDVSDKQLHYKNGDLISGSLEELIRHLIPTSSHYPDRAYIFAFLLSARLYIRPHELLERLAGVTRTEAASPEQRTHNAKVATGVLQLLSEWSDTFPYDFRDERVMAQVRVISQRCIQANPDLQREVRVVLQNLLDKLTCLEKYEDYVEKLNTEAVKLQNSTNVTDISEVCPSPLVLSQQLTHIELERLSYIGPEEFVQAFAKESPRIETAYKDLKTTKNLENYIQWFNRLSYMVATEVCAHVKKKQRVRLIEFWIEVGRECFNTGNFNSLMAIIAGLNMSPVSRLKKTWSRVDSSQLSVLEQQMSPSSNFLSYRRTLQAAMWRSTNSGCCSDGRQRIVIPFFSLLVKDLYFLNEGCANRLVDGHINFEKFWQLAKQVTEFIAWKQVTCPFVKDAKVIQYLMTGPVYDEHALWLASYECEHPENSFEKDRLKVLKSENNAT